MLGMRLQVTVTQEQDSMLPGMEAMEGMVQVEPEEPLANAMEEPATEVEMAASVEAEALAVPVL
jgi:hypothetical protein